MTLVVEDVATYLQSLGIGTIASNLFIGYMTDEPNKQMVVLTSGGQEPAYTGGVNTPIAYESHSIQIKARDVGYLAAATFAQQAYDALSNKVDVTITGSRYIRFHAIGLPIPLMPDENNRWEFSVNVVAMKAL